MWGRGGGGIWERDRYSMHELTYMYSLHQVVCMQEYCIPQVYFVGKYFLQISDS